MTRFTESMIFIFGMFAVAILVASAMMINSKTVADSSELKQYIAKKEDLLNSQDRLELAILELNATLQMKAAEQDALVKQINAISAGISEVSKLDASLVMPTPVIPTPAPVSAPATQPRPRVTRAS